MRGFYMKKIFIPIIVILLLAGCSRADKMDINIFFDGFNKASNEISFDIKNAVCENNNTYYCPVDSNILITLYTLKNGTVCECSVTSSKNNSKFKETFCSSVVSFCNFTEEEAESIYKNKTIKKDNYKFYYGKTDKSFVYIIKSEKYYPERNTSPTLKSHK